MDKKIQAFQDKEDRGGPQPKGAELCINRREVGAVIEVIASPFHPQLHTSASQGKFGAMANDRGQGAHHAQLTVLPKIGIKSHKSPNKVQLK